MLVRLRDGRITQALPSNVFPHNTFNWVGIDGTQVLCHMTPVGKGQRLRVDAFVLMGSSRHLHRTSNRGRCQQGSNEPQGPRFSYSDIPNRLTIRQNIESTDKALLVFGNGDGGGGPLAAMLENVITFLAFHLTKPDGISSFVASELQQTVLASFPRFPWDSLLTSFSRLSRIKPSLVAFYPIGTPFSRF